MCLHECIFNTCLYCPTPYGLCMSEYLQESVVRKPAPSPPGKPAPRVQVSHSTCTVEIRDCLCTHMICLV